MQIDREYEEWSQCDVQVLTSHLNSLASKSHTVGAGSRNYRKSYCFGTRKSKETVPKRPRRESSTTALKAVAERRELNHYP